MKIGLIGYEANIVHRVGSNQYAFELFKALSRLDQSNQYQIFLPTPPLADLPPERPGWHYVVCPSSRLWNLWELPRALFRSQKDLEVVFNPGHYLPPFSPCPLVASIMDLGYLRFPDQFNLSTRLKLKFWTGFSVRRAARLLAISEFTRRDLLATYNLPPQKVVTTLLGFDREKFHLPLPAEGLAGTRQKYRLPSQYFLFLGTLKPSKNLEGLIEAYSLLCRWKKNVPGLIIAGKKGWLYESIFAKARELVLKNKIIFTGFVPDGEVPFLLGGASVFVLPSFWEGFGIPVLEAMAVGTPVVAADVASLPEVVGKAGLLVDPRSPSIMAHGLWQAFEERKNLSAAGKIWVEHFSWENCARQTLAVLEAVVKERQV